MIPSRRKKGGCYVVTYSDLIQFSILIVALVGLCYQIFRDKKK
ncbi:putative holin-like toxin [Faecalicatena contorta]